MNTEQTIRDYLPSIFHLSLATSKDNRPWVCEVHFAYDEDLNLYFSSLPSSRHSQEILLNPYVAGNIVKQHQLNEGVLGVYFEGQAELLQPGETQQKAFERLMARLKPTADMPEQTKRPADHQIYKIKVSTYYVFGKLGDAPAQKYSLAWGK